MTQSFHSRMLLVFVGLILLAQAGTTTGMYFAAKHTANALAEQQLNVTERVVVDALGARDHEYRISLQALAADFAFRDAVSSHDAPTMASALANHAARVGADVAVLINNAGQIVAATDATLQSAASQTVVRALNAARTDSQSAVMANFNGKLLQLVVVPVRAPDTIAWVGMGFVVRDFVVDQMKAISGSDITMIAQGRRDPPAVAASTVASGLRAALDGELPSVLALGSNTQIVAIGGANFLTKTVSISGSGEAFSLILQMPERLVAAPLDSLRHALLLWAGPVTVLCLIAAMLFARFLAMPIQDLAAVARHLSAASRGPEADLRPPEDDVSSLAGAFHALAHRTQYDALTGLPNRTLFAEWLSSSLSRAEREKTPLAVVFVDLEGFRSINENLGRTMGDLVLRKTAQRLLRCMREADVVARLGADEFVLILEGVSQVGALKIVDRLMPIVSKPMQSPHGPIRVTMRAGIAVFPDHARDRESLLNLADAARHESKTRRQATVVARAPTLDTSPTMSLSVAGLRQAASSDTWSGAAWEGDDLSTQPLKTIDGDVP